MNLYQIVTALKDIALTHPNIRTSKDGNVYDIMNTNPSTKYSVFVVSQTTHRQTEQFDYYGFNLFYIDRLVDNLETNRLQIQSIGKQVLGNIIATFCEDYDVDFPQTVRYTPFTQKFQDETAGQYVTLEFEIPRDIICAEEY